VEDGMARRLFEYCAYTIVLKDTLEGIHKNKKGEGSLSENKPWVTGRRLLHQAQQTGVDMPILFGDAAWCPDLIYWAILREVTVGDQGTKYRFEHLKKLDGHSPQELLLRSTGKPIAVGFIRPYAICKTPAFLDDASSP
jgi:hypothetical protein